MAEGPRTSFRRFRELALRESDGVSVRLFWDSLDNEVFVRVRDRRHGDGFVLNPPKDQALVAFYHPYAPMFRPAPTQVGGGIVGRYEGGIRLSDDAPRRVSP